ncbi:MAG: tetratricopeptide repeat protein [Rhodospirillaceae bacterium]|nr:tetratricopeptide repeat protein [Rhodospirillaceae bacterium]
MRTRRLPARILAALVLLFGAHTGALADELADAFTAYEEGDYETAVGLLRPLADQGDVAAQTQLAVMFEKGHGVAADAVAAAEWYRLAADQGDTASQYRLGQMYLGGLGLPKDMVQAQMWMVIAAAHGQAAGSQERTMIDSNLSFDQREKAKRLTEEWLAAHPQ